MSNKAEIKKRAEEISLNMPGNWPDDKSQDIRISYIEQALLREREEVREETIRKCTSLIPNKDNGFCDGCQGCWKGCNHCDEYHNKETNKIRNNILSLLKERE